MPDRSRVSTRPPCAAPILLVLVALLPALALATPLNFGTGSDGKPVSARWPDSTAIHVYIPTPPNPPGACAVADARAGMQRWASALAQRGITVQFHDNQAPPAGATNAVGVEWVSPGSLGGTNQGRGSADAQDVPGGAAIQGGTVQVETDEACGEGMRNLFMHEFGHVLGLGDEATEEGDPHNVMDHDVPEDAPMTFSPRDSAEMKSLYGFFAAAPPSLPKGGLTQSITPVGSPPVFRYEYFVEWFAGPEIPAFDLSLGGPPGSVAVVAMPPGWQVASPPFYLDCGATPGVTEDTRELHFFAVGEGIGEAMPLGTFVLESSVPPVPGWGLPLVDMEEDGLFEPIAVLVPGYEPTGVPESSVPRSGLRWLSPSPNPFRDATRLRFASPVGWRDGRVDVYDVHGRLLRTIDLGPGGAGEAECAWDGGSSQGRPVGPGAYFVRVTLDGASVMGTVTRTR